MRKQKMTKFDLSIIKDHTPTIEGKYICFNYDLSREDFEKQGYGVVTSVYPWVAVKGCIQVWIRTDYETALKKLYLGDTANEKAL